MLFLTCVRRPFHSPFSVDKVDCPPSRSSIVCLSRASFSAHESRLTGSSADDGTSELSSGIGEDVEVLDSSAGEVVRVEVEGVAWEVEEVLPLPPLLSSRRETARVAEHRREAREARESDIASGRGIEFEKSWWGEGKEVWTTAGVATRPDLTNDLLHSTRTRLD